MTFLRNSSQLGGKIIEHQLGGNFCDILRNSSQLGGRIIEHQLGGNFGDIST